MATHSTVLAWRIPWTEEPGGLESVGSPRGGLDWSNLEPMHTRERSNSVKPDFLTDDSEVTERSEATELEITKG